jgi:phosphate transport system substrate-binding protein
VEAGENDNLIVQKLEANADALGVFGYSFLEENSNKIKGVPIDGVAPSYEKIAGGEYKVSRPLFIYAKKQHIGVVPGMAEFVTEYVSDKAMGEDGYLAAKGLVTLPPEEAAKTKAIAKDLETLKGDALM